MSQVRTVARRELRAFFDHPTAYVLAIAFLALGLFLAFRSLYASGVASLRPFFDLLPWLFAVFVPAVTMRSLAEERRGHTLEWLMAQPVDEFEVVTGKFLGNWAFVLATLLGTIPMAVGVLLWSDADPGIIVAQYVGAALLAAQGVSVGLWASALTRNQITAFILATGLSLALVLLGTPVVQIGLPPAIGGALARLSVLSHFQNVARGVIDLRDVLYFASTAGLFLAFTWAALAGQRLSPERGSFRRLRRGVLALAALVAVLNLLGGHIRGRLDLTRGNLYTLSPGTREILGDLDDLVTLKLVVSKELPPEVQLTLRDVRDLVADMARAADGKLVVEEIDPSDDEDAAEEARSLGIYPLEFNVLRDDEFEVRRGWFGLAVQYADERETIPAVDRTDDLEFRLVAAIDRMTDTTRPVVAFLTGYGAKGAVGFPAFQQALVDRFDIRTIDLQRDTVPSLGPDTIDAVVVAAPNQRLDSAAVAAVRHYVELGGPALLLLESNELSPQSPSAVPVVTGLEGLTADAGIRLGSGLVMDWQSNATISTGRQGIFNLLRPYPLWPIALPAGDHTITRDLANVTFGWVAPLDVSDDPRVIPLWVTSAAANRLPPGSLVLPESLPAPDPDSVTVQVLAAAFDPAAAADGDEDRSSASLTAAGVPDGRGSGTGPVAEAREDAGAGPGEAADGGVDPERPALTGRMVVVGDATFLEDQFVGANPQNLAFAANALDWLLQDEALISIRSKNRRPPQLVFSSEAQKAALKWISLIGVPLLYALVGFVRVSGRQRRAQRRWQEVIG
ncbi:MAG: hypothetical protein D6701_14025 [Gemmatimonadetes bacterium]|nr:MAG: hypothetical protein D6701_14025 [Gemmatimonadota bacterium]